MDFGDLGSRLLDLARFDVRGGEDAVERDEAGSPDERSVQEGERLVVPAVDPVLNSQLLNGPVF